jgi:RNA recognition motif-containing protein
MSDAPPAPVSDNAAAAPQDVEETPGYKVFAGNLAYSTNDEGLKALFEGVSTDITSAQVIQRGNRSAGYGFVSFATLEAANKAVAALNQKEFEGRTLIVEIAKPTEQKDKERSEKRAKRRAGRRGSKAPPGEVTEAEANGEAADKPEGAATDASAAAKPKKKRNLRKKAKKAKQAVDAATGAATETPANGDAAANATTNTTTIKKKTSRPQRKRVPRPAGEPPVGEPSKTVLFVANLGFSIDDTQLAEIFTDNGITVISARVVRKRWGTPRKSKGYGFVDVGSEEQQKKALETLQGKVVDGRELAVKIAVNAQDKEEEEQDAAAEGNATAAAPETATTA